MVSRQKILQGLREGEEEKVTQKFQTLDDAIALATFAHRSQKDKAGLDYIQHPLRVLAKVQAQGALPYVQIAAILHDVTEDTAFTTNILAELGFSEAALQIIDLLDRHTSWNRFNEAPQFGVSADDYYYKAIRLHSGALMVKLADIEDNLSPWRLAYLTEDTQNRLRAKYAKAEAVLRGYVPFS